MSSELLGCSRLYQRVLITGITIGMENSVLTMDEAFGLAGFSFGLNG